METKIVIHANGRERLQLTIVARSRLSYSYMVIAYYSCKSSHILWLASAKTTLITKSMLSVDKIIAQEHKDAQNTAEKKHQKNLVLNKVTDEPNLKLRIFYEKARRYIFAPQFCTGYRFE